MAKFRPFPKARREPPLICRKSIPALGGGETETQGIEVRDEEGACEKLPFPDV